MKFSRFAALFSKECRQIVRDPSSILIAFVLPIILIIIFTYAVSLDMNHLKIAVILEDDSAPARSLAGAFLANSHFESRVSADRRAFERDLVAGHIRGIVIIPRRFGEKLRQGEIKPLEVITDGSEPNTANFVQNYAQGVWAVWFGQHQALTGGTLTPTPDSETRIWYNPELESRHFLLPGALALIMTLIGTLLTARMGARHDGSAAQHRRDPRRTAARQAGSVFSARDAVADAVGGGDHSGVPRAVPGELPAPRRVGSGIPVFGAGAGAFHLDRREKPVRSLPDRVSGGFHAEPDALRLHL